VLWCATGIHPWPLLFLLYVEDMQFCSKLLKFILFADDTNIFASHVDLTDLFAIENAELCHLADWCRANKLSLNLKKTHFMIFGPRSCIFSQDLSLLPNIIIDGNIISCVDTSKFLGVLIDEHLNCSGNHILIKL